MMTASSNPALTATAEDYLKTIYSIGPTGAAATTAEITLGELTSGERARVERVSDRSPEMLRYLDELALRPGAAVMVISRAPFDGPIAIEAEGTVRSIGRLLAAQVLVAAER